MPTLDPRSADRILSVVRRGLVLILVLAMVGIFAELLLVEHFEDAWQFVPLVLLVLGLAGVAWHARAPSRASLRTLRSLMTAFMIAGLIGFYLHFRGNVEFELEENPNATRWVLFKEAMMGATPALAPGVMIQIGLIGLLYAFVSGTASETAKMSEVRRQNSEFRTPPGTG
jgi:hypothetical protein